jgi:hypothetical protein
MIDYTGAGVFDRFRELGFNTGNGHIIKDENTPVPQRTNLKFTGNGVLITDDGGNDDTVVSIEGGNAIQEEGVTLTKRQFLNFIGDSITAVDNPGNDATDVTVDVPANTGNFFGTALVSGGLVTATGGLGFNVAAGVGIIPTQNTDGTTTINRFSFPSTNFTHTGGDGSFYLTITSGGTVVSRALPAEPAVIRSEVSIAGYAVTGGALTGLDTTGASAPNQGLAQLLIEYFLIVGAILDGINVDGIASTLTFDLTAGKVFYPNINKFNDINLPNHASYAGESTISFLLTKQNVSLTSWDLLPAQTTLPVAQYDNAGTLTTLANNSWQVLRYYSSPTANIHVIEYGQNTYASSAEALANARSENHNGNPALNDIIPVAFFIVRGGATDILDSNDVIVSNDIRGTGGGGGGSGQAVTLQNAYVNSPEPEFQLNNTNGGISTADASTPITGNLFEVQNFLNTIKYLAVDTSGIRTDGQAYSTLNTLTDAVNIATDCNLGNVHEVTLTDNRTLDNPTNLKAGATYIWYIKQDATGSRTLAYGSAFKFPGGTAPTLTTDANAVDILTGVSDGTNVHCNLAGDFK